MSLVGSKVQSPKKKDHRKIQQLIKQLLKVWSSKGVQQNYQNYYLTYLDSIPDHLVEIQISREIKKTLQNKSHYFNINKSLALQGTSVAKLRLAIDKLESQNKISTADLEYVCELINELRDNNMLVAENTLNFNYESSSKSNSQFGFVYGNNYIFEKINADNQFLKSSFLRKYIVFTHSYDPFFLYHYETAKTTNDAKYKSLPCIEQLFNLSISKAYKIMKLQKQILQFLSGKVPSDRAQPKKKTKRYNYSLVNDNNLYQTAIQETSAENLTTNRPQNNSHVNRNRAKSQFKGIEQSPFLRHRANTESDAVSRYFNNVIGKNKNESEVKYFPRIQSRQRQSPKRSQVFNSRRQKILSIGNEDEMIPVTLKDSMKRDSIYLIKKRQKEFKSNLPLKYAQPDPVNEQMLQVEQAQINDIRGASLSRNQQQEDPLTKKNASTLHYRGSSLIQNQSLLKTPPANLKNFKLKAGNLSPHSLLIFLRQLNIQQTYRKTFQIGNWEHSIRNNQYYLHKFYINEVMMAISLCCALPEGDIVIKYWGPTTECQTQMSHFLFKKYLEHIERQTVCKAIFYNANPIGEVLGSGFQLYRERIYNRERVLPIQIENFSYYPFLSLDFSSIVISKSISKEILDKLIVPSNIYEIFNQKQFYCFNYLLIINKLINPGQFKAVGSYSANLKSMKEVQTQMIKQQLFFNPYNLQSPVNPINLLTLKLRNPIYSAFFLCQRPYIKLAGNQIYHDQQSLIVSLQMLKNNTVLYFGKGFRSIGQMLSVLKNKPTVTKSVEYCVRMFTKRMRGKIQSINLRDQICYGDVEVIFQWKDFLKGKIQHNFDNFSMFGSNNQSFYCLVEIDNEHIFIFQVLQRNFI